MLLMVIGVTVNEEDVDVGDVDVGNGDKSSHRVWGRDCL